MGTTKPRGPTFNPLYHRNGYSEQGYKGQGLSSLRDRPFLLLMFSIAERPALHHCGLHGWSRGDRYGIPPACVTKHKLTFMQQSPIQLSVWLLSFPSLKVHLAN